MTERPRVASPREWMSLAYIISAALWCNAVDAVRDRFTRAHRTPSPVAPASTRSKSGSPHHPCAVCRERRATEGDVCDECDVWLISLAYVNRDACERAS